MKRILKNVLPYGFVSSMLSHKHFKSLGFSSADSWKGALSAAKQNALDSTRLNLLPSGSIPKLEYVVDVGANEGLWSLGVLSLCRPKRLIAIEPLPAMQSTLKARLRRYPNAKVLGVAVGDQKGTTEFYLTSHTHTGSILQPKEEMNEFYGHGWDITGRITVPVEPLDDILRELPAISLLKIDAQGYERFVIEGARETLKKTRFVLLEVNFISHYHGDLVFAELDAVMAQHGFHLENLLPDCRQGRALWADALYTSKAE